MTAYIAPVVEGQTEQVAVERLLQRVWGELVQAPFRLQVLPPSRGRRDRLVEGRRPDLATKLEEAWVYLGPRLADQSARGVVLVLLDAEEDCPAALGPSLLGAARDARPDVPAVCVLARRMFENWLVAGAADLPAGTCGLPKPLSLPTDCEGVSGATWLKRQIGSADPGRSYSKKVDALKLVRLIDLAACRANSPSFDKLCRELERLAVPPPEVPAAGSAPAADRPPTSSPPASS